jgi:hypothetical protein
MHVSETHAEVATVMVVHSQGGILIGNLRMVKAHDSLEQQDRSCLKLNSLEEIPKLELNRGNLCNASCNFLCHWSSYLQKEIVGLTEEIKSFIHCLFFQSLISLYK